MSDVQPRNFDWTLGGDGAIRARIEHIRRIDAGSFGEVHEVPVSFLWALTKLRDIAGDKVSCSFIRFSIWHRRDLQENWYDRLDQLRKMISWMKSKRSQRSAQLDMRISSKYWLMAGSWTRHIILSICHYVTKIWSSISTGVFQTKCKRTSQFRIWGSVIRLLACPASFSRKS